MTRCQAPNLAYLLVSFQLNIVGKESWVPMQNNSRKENQLELPVYKYQLRQYRTMRSSPEAWGFLP